MLWGRAGSASAAVRTLSASEAAGSPDAGFRGTAGVAEPTDAGGGAAVVGDAESPDAADVFGASDIS